MKRNGSMLVVCLSLVAAMLGGCSWSTDPIDCNSTPWAPGVCAPQQHRVALRTVSGCGDLLGSLKETALEEMYAEVEQNLAWALEYPDYCYGQRSYEYDDGLGMPSTSNQGSQPGGASQYSTTNTQEAGVDEADFVKNDGRYIYLLAGDGFKILEAWPAQQTREIASVEVEGIVRYLYVHNDRAVVYSDIFVDGEDGLTGGRYDDCYCDMFDCSCGGPESNLKITVLNIQNRRQPYLEREILLTGSYLNSRRIGDAVHTVVTFPEVSAPGLRSWPQELESCDRTFTRQQIAVAFARMLANNERIIEETSLADWLPSIQETRYLADGRILTDEGLLQDCQNFYEPSLPAGSSFLSVVSLDVTDVHGLHISSIVGQRGVVYASHQALYVANHYVDHGQGDWFYDDAAQVTEATTIHKFALSGQPAAATYVASGIVAGRVLNQFSMGEHNGHLRMATTTGHVRNPETHNSVFVLEEQGDVLQTIGLVTGLAPTEDIRSARFVGDRAFVVTFKKTDPLYAIDLSDPHNPFVAGELKIPGFSTYIHMMDDDHLLTIGFDADDQGEFAWFQGIELQVFDVSDMADPTQVHKEILGTRGTSSEATANHLAFNYFAPLELLALPMAICEESSGGGSYGDVLTFSGLIVWDLDTSSGFSERGRVAFPIGEDDGCHNWWTNPNSRVKRSIIMDDYVFSIADTLLKVSHVGNLGADLVVLELPPIPQNPDNYGY